MFIEVHFIQSFPPSVLNRDDTNNPKDCYFGGARRLRVSSQCFKRAMRHNPVFAETTGLPLETKRTKLMATEWIMPALVSAGKPEAEAEKVALAFARLYGGKLDGKENAALIYLSPQEVEDAVKGLLEQWEAVLAEASKPPKKDEEAEPKASGSGKSKKEKSPLNDVVNRLVAETERRTSAPDIALFGRMMTGKTELNLDAAAQVAQAISTHAIRKFDFDYYTALDELKPKDGMGAAMVGLTPFASACFYRYARLDWDLLTKNLRLKDDPSDDSLARKTVAGFLRAAEAAVPTGKQTNFDNQSRPVFMLAVAREGGPGWSLVNAFEKPVYGMEGYVSESIKRLDVYWNSLLKFYGKKTVKAVAVGLLPMVEPEDMSEALQSAIKPTMDEWVQAMLDALPKGIAA